ncbi:MAG: YdbL family protein [Hyphomonadaceae bacterium]
MIVRAISGAVSGGLLALALVAAPSPAAAQADEAAALRASLKAGEQADGFMGVVDGAGDAAIRAQVDQINIKRRAAYTDLAAKRGVSVQEVAGATACTLFAQRVGEGQYYRDESGVWKRRAGSIPAPSFCPK